MSDILDRITAVKRQQVEQRKEQVPMRRLEKSLLFEREGYPLAAFLRDDSKSGVIAEFKRRSPSKGFIREGAKVEDIAPAYQAAGASAVSVLTETEFFAGADEDLSWARELLSIPVLRKDFVVDEYQIVEAKSLGADAVLLIAACLEPKKLKSFAQTAKSLGLSVLMEVHSREELLDNLHDSIDVFGVNNRNLKTFEVSLDTSFDLLKELPRERARISESGLSRVEDLLVLRRAGYDGFLIGESFMKAENPGKAAHEFLKPLLDR